MNSTCLADFRSLWNTTVGKVGNTVAQLFLKNDPDRTWSLYDVSPNLFPILYHCADQSPRSTTSPPQSTASTS